MLKRYSRESWPLSLGARKKQQDCESHRFGSVSLSTSEWKHDLEQVEFSFCPLVFLLSLFLRILGIEPHDCLTSSLPSVMIPVHN